MTVCLFRQLGFVPLLLVLLIYTPQAKADSPSISMAIFPYGTPSHLIKAHQPLKQHLSQAVQKPIHMVSARDFSSFTKAIRAGNYDIILGAPHMGRLAERTQNYEWLGFTSNHSYAVIATQKHNLGKSLADFKGQQIILPPRSAIVNYLSRQALLKAGVRPDIDIEIIETRSHQSAMLAAVGEIYPLAGFGKPTWKNYTPPGRDNLIKLFQSNSIPGFAVMAHRRLGPKKVTQLRHAFLHFAETTEGQRYFAEQGLHNSRPQTAEDMPQLDAFLSELGMLKGLPKHEEVK